MKLKIYEHAVVDFNDEDTATLAALLTRLDENDNEVERAPDFPLEKAKVVFNGNQATISIASPNRRNRRICRLTEAKLVEPKREGDATVITGTAVELLDMGFSVEDAQIRAVIESFVTCQTC